MEKRIESLDGLRAVAALMVVLHHYFSRWTYPEADVNFYPYGSAYSEFPLFQFGYMGVPLFFVISGFVIALTLHGARGPIDFAVRRFARLWPAMVVCSTLTLGVLLLVPHPLFEEHLENILPSWTFTHPLIFEAVMQRKVDWVDGAYWSLFTEIRFYAWAALVYFVFRARFFVAFWSLASAAIALWLICAALGLETVTAVLHVVFFPEYLGWFLMGIAVYQLHRGENLRLAHAVNAQCILLLVVIAFTHGLHPTAEAISVLMIAATFYVFLYLPRALAPLGHLGLGALGAASYSLYLLHQNIGVTLIAYLTPALGLPGEIVAVAMIGVCILAALAVHRFCEVPAKRLILGWYGSFHPARALPAPA